MKKLQIWWPLLFAITLVAGMSIGFRLRKNIPQSQNFFSGTRSSSLQEVMDLIKTRYVDSVNTDSLAEDAIQAMVAKLDPHTLYIPYTKTEEVNEDLKGNFEGIGVEYLIINDTVNAVNVLAGGPSDKAGLKVGDKFLKVGDSVVAGNGINPERIRKLLRGESGSTVKVELRRNNQSVSTTITRGTIPKYAVDAAYMMDATTGFIHLKIFSRTAYEEFMAALEKLKKQGMKKLIFDLRGNGGGILEEAVDIADEFLDSTRLVLYTEGIHTKRRDYICKRPGLFEKGELVVLVDEFTASASEVVTGALQDWDRATIIGRRSFGKGLVQEPFDLSDGSQIRLTVSKYYTPSGRNIQKPFSADHSSYGEEVYDRFHNGQAYAQDTSLHSGAVYRTKLKKRIVYGGGGISPDLFIPLDSAGFSRTNTPILSGQVLSKYLYEYYINHLAAFSKFKTAAEFEKGFVVSDESWNEIKIYGQRDSLNTTSIDTVDRQELNKRFKTLMALQIWRLEGFYVIANQTDKVVLKARETLK